MSIAQDFFNIVQRYGNRIAVDDPESGSITYKDFAGLVAYFANHYRQLGEAPRILIELPQGTLAYAAMMGSVVSGATYAPVNVRSPVARLARIADQFTPDLIVSQLNVPSVTERHSDFGISPSDASSYVIFTSGSTGTPKGVEISRTAHALYVNNWREYTGIGPDDRVSQHPAISFDASVSDIYGALTSGATLIPFGSNVNRMLPGRKIKSAKISIWNSTPSVIDLMLNSGELESDSMPDLKIFSSCGEALLPRHVLALRHAAPDVKIFNAYGPTEATVGVTCAEIKDSDLIYTSLPLGDALPGNRIELINDEIVIAGAQLAEGYWRDPQQTENSFRVADIGQGPETVYFTGDLAKIIDNKLFFCERIDHQVKINGYRVELEEVARAVSDAAGLPTVAIDLDNKIYAVVEGKVVNIVGRKSEILQATAKTLDSYAVPVDIVCVDHFPKTLNDKVDRSEIKRIITSNR